MYNYKALINNNSLWNTGNYSARENKEKSVMARQMELDYGHRSLSVRQKPQLLPNYDVNDLLWVGGKVNDIEGRLSSIGIMAR